MAYDKLSDREIDVLVAERVMGWPRVNKTYELQVLSGLQSPTRHYLDYELPRFSADIAAAWAVVEKLAPNRQFELESLGWLDEPWTAKFHGEKAMADANAKTAPRAIVIAALKATETS